MSQRREFEKWFGGRMLPAESGWFIRDKDEPDEYDSATVQYAWEAWQVSSKHAAEDGLITKLCVNEDVAEKVVRFLLKDDVKCRDGVYKITVCRVADGKLC